MTRSPSGLLRLVSGGSSRLSTAAAGSVAVSLAGVAFRFGIQVVLAHLLGTSAYGVFVTLRGWGELAAAVPNRGHQGTAVRFLPQYAGSDRPDLYRGLIRHGLRTTAITAIALAAVGVVVASITTDHSTPAIGLAMATIPAWALLRMLQSILQAQHRFVIASFLVQVGQPVVLAVLVAAIWAAADVELDGALMALLVSVAITGGVALLEAKRVEQATVGLGPIAAAASEWRSAANHFFLGQLSIAVIGMADVLILAFFVEPSKVALYSVASRIAILGRVVNSGLESIVAPRIAETWNRGDHDGLQRLVSSTIKIAAGPTIGLALLLAVFRQPLLGIFGPEYRTAGTIMLILLVGNVINALTGPSGYLVSLTGHEHIHARLMATTAIGLVVACLIVAGPAGGIGVAIARTVTTAAWNLSLVGFARQRLGIRCYLRPPGMGP